MLNRPLYDALHQLFGDVGIVNEDEQGNYEAVPADYDPNRYVFRRNGHGGQQFRVNCPKCSDKKARLYFSHKFGTRSTFEGKPVSANRLVVCQNQKCHTADICRDIWEIIKQGRDTDEEPEIFVQTKRKISALELPPGCVAIDSSKANPAVVKYLTGRGFDIAEMSSIWGVQACSHLPEFNLGAVSIYPHLQGGGCALWQARASFEPPKSMKIPKYYTQGQKSEILYGRDIATLHFSEVIVIVEGVLDAIRMGPGAVAIFGKSPSVTQTRILKTAFRNKFGVLMLDADAAEDADKWYKLYKGSNLFAKGLAIARLKDGQDPGSMSRDDAWAVAQGALEDMLANAGTEETEEPTTEDECDSLTN